MREKDTRRAALARRDATAVAICAGDFIGSAIAKISGMQARPSPRRPLVSRIDDGGSMPVPDGRMRGIRSIRERICEVFIKPQGAATRAAVAAGYKGSRANLGKYAHDLLHDPARSEKVIAAVAEERRKFPSAGHRDFLLGRVRSWPRIDRLRPSIGGLPSPSNRRTRRVSMLSINADLKRRALELT
jgi:hypothetical protein